MELIDTHLHLIDRAWTGYAWTQGVEPLREGDFTLDRARALYGDRVRGSIFMEVDADDWHAESRQIGALIREGLLLGQIANCRPETDEGFEAWLDEGPGLGVVGYRRLLHTVPEEVSRTATFRDNVRRIGARGLPFDVNVLGRTLHLARDLARACPEVSFVLDHCGTPDVAGGEMEPWRKSLVEVAACPNVTCKLSGITAYASPGEGDGPTVGPWIDHVLDCFGPARMVWGSDWPVVDLGAGLPGWIAITEAVLSRLSVDEAADIGWRNAERVYGVQSAPYSAALA